MRIVPVVLFLGLSSPSYAQQGPQDKEAQDDKDKVIQQLEDKLQQLEKRVGELEDPVPVPATPVPAATPAAGTPPSATVGPDGESVLENAATKVREPTFLNVGAPGLENLNIYGGFRVRGQTWQNFITPVPPPQNRDSTTNFGQDATLGFDFSLSATTSVLFELHDSRVWGEDLPAGTNINEDLYVSQAYLLETDILGTGWDAKVGRQIIAVGSQRVLGDDPWLLNRAPFDGATVGTDIGADCRFEIGGYRVSDEGTFTDNDLFPFGGGGALGDENAAEIYYGQYTSDSEATGTINAYAIFADFDTASGAAIAIGGETRYWTFGARWAHELGPIYFDTEAATQYGQLGGMWTDDIYKFDVWALYTRVGMNFEEEDIPVVKKVYIGHDYATGDDNAGDTRSETFVQINPKLHGWFGIMDFGAWSNVKHYTVGTSLDIPYGELDLSYHWLRRDEGSAFFGGYNSFVPGTTGGSRDIGQELDAVYTIDLSGEESVEDATLAPLFAADLGAGIFFPGTAYSFTSGRHSNTIFAYVEFSVGF